MLSQASRREYNARLGAPSRDGAQLRLLMSYGGGRGEGREKLGGYTTLFLLLQQFITVEVKNFCFIALVA